MKKYYKPKNHILPIVIIAGIGFALGAVIQWLMMAGNFITGFLAGGILIFFVGSLLYLTWSIAGKGRVLAWMMLVAFLIRMVYGVFLSWGLPRLGYDTREQRSGFVYADAYRRERHAWFFARSERALTAAFDEVYETDQYGGLLALSTIVYRYLSPDTRRPWLVSIVSSGAMALSLPFLMAAVKRRLEPSSVILAGWITALYPESVLLSASQMREPFIILFFTILFWAVMHLFERTRLKLAIPALIVSSILLLMFSLRMGGLLIGSMFLLIWVMESPRLEKSWLRIMGWVLVAFAIGVSFWVVRDWFTEVLQWDALQTIARSGRIQFHLSQLPEMLHLPFILVYGFFQPVLPAAIAAPAPWIWRSLGIFRSLGWYLLLPLLIYTFIRVWRAKPVEVRRWLLVLIFMVWVGVIIASARAGGDQWDNPRYRTVFLPWMVTSAAWALQYAWQTKDRWLLRGFLIEGIFLAFFTQWYLSRYYQFMPRLELWQMVGLISILSLFVIVFGWLKDRKQAVHSLTGDGESL